MFMRSIEERGRFNLVTGATGFVGGHLVNHLLGTGEPVRVLLRNAESAQQFRRLGAEVVLGDVCDRLSLDGALKWSKAVYHCAAASDFASDDEIRRTNLNGVRNVLHSARRTECGRVVLMSSLNVSKAVREETVSEDAPATRTGEVFSDVEIDAEALALQFTRDHDVDVTIVRPGWVYGPGEQKMSTLDNVLRLGKFAFVGRRGNIIPLVFVTDLIRVMVRSAHAEAARGRIYNVTDGSKTTTANLVKVLAGLMGYQIPRRVISPLVARVDWALIGCRRPYRRGIDQILSHSRHVLIDRAQEELGYRPLMSLRQGLQKTLPWLLHSASQDPQFRRTA